MQYLFFVGNVASKCKIDQNKNYYFDVVKDLLRNYKKYLEFNDHLLRRGAEKNGLMRKLSFHMKHKVNDNQKHIMKTEDDII